MAEKILMKGNEAIAISAIRNGADGYFGYPITPQSEVMETLMKERPWLTTGMVVLQAESETSSINMVYGGASCGKKVLTSSSSPGISLMCEGISYLAGAELPCVVVNCQRGGPGLGTIQASQSDYYQCVKGGGHGDYNAIVLAPSSAQDMYDHVDLGFDLAFKDSVAYCDGTTFTIENDNITINGEPNARRVLVKSVSGEMIPTREDFAMFIKQCENNLKLISEDVKLYNITDFGAYIRGLVYTTLDAIMPEIAAINVHYLIERTNFDKLSLKNALETELDIIDEIKEQFSEGAINYTKIYSLKKSALLSEYTRFEILELVENEFSTTQLEKFVDNVINSTEEVKELILKNLVKI